MTTVYVSEESLKSLVHHKLHTAGLDADTAQQVTDVLIHADITGVHSHGVMRVEHYCTRLAAGGLNKAPQFSIEQISLWRVILFCRDDHQQRIGCYRNDANRYLCGSPWRRRALFGN